MRFNSTEFILIFLTFAVLLHFDLTHRRVKAALSATTLTSFLFYVWWILPFVMLPVCAIFFFSSRRRHTRSLRDRSSDVCSSDLDGHDAPRLIDELVPCRTTMVD